MEELGELMSRLRDEIAVRAVVLTGSGRYFSGGGSFDLFATLDTSESAERMRRASRKLYKDMLEVGQPIVCAVNGPAIGAGCSLVLLSDFAFASSTVTLSDPHVRRGLTAADGAAIWTMFMGPIRAKRFLLTGQELTAAQAADLGMFTVVCDPDNAVAGDRVRARTRRRRPARDRAHEVAVQPVHQRDLRADACGRLRARDAGLPEPRPPRGDRGLQGEGRPPVFTGS